MTQQEFNIEIETKATPPKGWIWALLGGIIKKWLYNNADVIGAMLVRVIKTRTKPMGIMGDSCGNVPRPKNQLTPNGSWECILGSWTWVEDLG